MLADARPRFEISRLTAEGSTLGQLQGSPMHSVNNVLMSKYHAYVIMMYAII